MKPKSIEKRAAVRSAVLSTLFQVMAAGALLYLRTLSPPDWLGGLLLIMLTGYLIIYNIFQISVIRDIRYYGLLKTIGATSRQVKKILRRQALFLGLMGIPLGLVLGFLIGTGITPKIVEISSYEYTEMEVSANPWIFLGAAVFTMADAVDFHGKSSKDRGKGFAGGSSPLHRRRRGEAKTEQTDSRQKGCSRRNGCGRQGEENHGWRQAVADGIFQSGKK